MAITVEILENGQIVCLRVCDPWTILEMINSYKELWPFFDRKDGMQVHGLVDLSKARTLPPNVLHARIGSPFISHPNHGVIALFGADPLVRRMADIGFKLVRMQDIGFFDSEERAISFIQEKIATQQ
jgi:hypothetical protein